MKKYLLISQILGLNFASSDLSCSMEDNRVPVYHTSSAAMVSANPQEIREIIIEKLCRAFGSGDDDSGGDDGFFSGCDRGRANQTLDGVVTEHLTEAFADLVDILLEGLNEEESKLGVVLAVGKIPSKYINEVLEKDFQLLLNDKTEEHTVRMVKTVSKVLSYDFLPALMSYKEKVELARHLYNMQDAQHQAEIMKMISSFKSTM